ncbi:MAG: hypothetical protein ACK5L6_12350 [Anaerorhabdus sp.]|uniref:hypothetical protein n=1 Tax=Anaerorhabdus sp. TaxID=1872524 RepID=UPI003A8A887E
MVDDKKVQETIDETTETKETQYTANHFVDKINLDDLSDEKVASYIQVVDDKGNAVEVKVLNYTVKNNKLLVEVLLPNGKQMEVDLNGESADCCPVEDKKTLYIAGGVILASVLTVVGLLALKKRRKD